MCVTGRRREEMEMEMRKRGDCIGFLSRQCKIRSEVKLLRGSIEVFDTITCYTGRCSSVEM